MKVKIAGAGPVGSVAAIAALRQGHEIEMFEEHERSGYPQHCSGLISREGLESLSDMVDYRQFVINPISGAVFDFAGERFEIDKKAETAYVINRAELDSALAQKAMEEGAKINYGKQFRVKQEDAIIGADGALSSVAHHFNFPKIGKFAFTLKTSAKLEIEESDKVRLFYDNSAFPGFFGWLIPYSEYEAEIGMGTTSQRALAPGFRFLLKKFYPLSHEKPRGKIIPLSRRPCIAGRFGKTNVLLAGDAAGQVKSSSGGGVVFGTAGARLAGLYAHAPYLYEQEFAMQNSADLLAHSFLQNFFALQPNFCLRLTAAVSRALGLESIFSLYGNMDRPTRIFSSILAHQPVQYNSILNSPI